MYKDPRKKIFYIGALIFTIFVIIFAYGRYRPYLQGASISNLSISENQIVDGSHQILSGNLHKVSDLRVNGEKVLFNTDNYFEKNLVLPPQYSIIEIVFTDSFGRSRSQEIPVYSKQNSESLPLSYADALDSKSLTEIDEENLLNNIN